MLQSIHPPWWVGARLESSKRGEATGSHLLRCMNMNAQPSVDGQTIGQLTRLLLISAAGLDWDWDWDGDWG